MDNLTNLYAAENQTPIEIALGVDEQGMTTARRLYDFLCLDSSHFARWAKRNITDNEFVTEGEDYLRLAILGETPTGGELIQDDYKLTAHFAKKLCMKGAGVRGEQAREYFTRIEERAKQNVIDRNSLSPQMQVTYMMLDKIAAAELEQKRQASQIAAIEEKQKSIEQKQDAIADTFENGEDSGEFTKWAKKCITKIAESPKFASGMNRSHKYASAWNESYERLNKKRACRLDDRVERARGRALNRGWSRTKCNQEISKLTIISEDKNLRPAYESVVREMMVHYCVK